MPILANCLALLGKDPASILLRPLYRALSELWDRLGVDNRNEGIALAAENGWI